MDDKDLTIQDLRRENALLRKERDAAVADIERLLSQDTIMWRCWACAHSYESTPCNALWRGLDSIDRAGAQTESFDALQKAIGNKNKPPRKRKR